MAVLNVKALAIRSNAENAAFPFSLEVTIASAVFLDARNVLTLSLVKTKGSDVLLVERPR